MLLRSVIVHVSLIPLIYLQLSDLLHIQIIFIRHVLFHLFVARSTAEVHAEQLAKEALLFLLLLFLLLLSLLLILLLLPFSVVHLESHGSTAAHVGDLRDTWLGLEALVVLHFNVVLWLEVVVLMLLALSYEDG